MNKYKNPLGGGVCRVGHFAISGLAVAAAIVATSIAAPASAAPAFENHIVEPANDVEATVNLFDYWRTTRDDVDSLTPANVQDLGINKGHVLIFGKSNSRYGWWNGYVGNGLLPRTGIVARMLGDDGYPYTTISDEDLASTATTLGNVKNESLAYLFDPTIDSPYKASYTCSCTVKKQATENNR